MRHWTTEKRTAAPEMVVECVICDESGAPKSRRLTPLHEFLGQLVQPKSTPLPVTSGHPGANAQV